MGFIHFLPESQQDPLDLRGTARTPRRTFDFRNTNLKDSLIIELAKCEAANAQQTQAITTHT